MTQPQQPAQGQHPGPRWPPSEGTWRNVVLALVAVAIVVAALVLVSPVVDAIEGATTDSTTALTGTTTIRSGDRRATVVLATGVGDETVVSAGVVRPSGAVVAARVLGPTAERPQFTVVLGQPAPRGGATVEWKAAGLEGGSGASPDWTTEWVVVLALMLSSLLAALVAFTIAVRRRQAGADGKADVGPELASFLKVAALLMIAALALIAVMLATDDKSLTGLFALLGTIAGYLAGNRSETPGGGRRGPRPRRNQQGSPNPPDEDLMLGGGMRSLL